MERSVYILLKNGKSIEIEKFKYLNYISVGETVTVKKFDDFYLYDTLITFVGEGSIVTLNSESIEYVQFYGDFSEK